MTGLGCTNYKFEDDNVYSEANAYSFIVAGTYEFDTTRKQLTLWPEEGDPIVKSYEIDQSLLILKEGKEEEEQYTKNPETGGGFNEEPASAPLGGMWQNVNDYDDVWRFNKDGEYFKTRVRYNEVQKNRDEKYWWNVVGTYEYNGDKKQLTVWPNGIDDETASAVIYTIEFSSANRVLKLTSKGITTTFNKQNDL
jgi:hypothetical protein